MTVLMPDAVASLPAAAAAEYKQGDLTDILYADDTMLLGTSAKSTEAYLCAVETEARRYGLHLNYNKIQLLNIRTSAAVRTLSGQIIPATLSMVYWAVCWMPMARP